MKTLLLLVCITTVNTLSAQNKDVFDINSHLQQLIKEGKLPWQKNNQVNLLSGRPGNPPSLSIIFSNGDIVYTFPQYNMPVITPAPSNQHMPNGATGHPFILHQTNAIPNPAPPLIIGTDKNN